MCNIVKLREYISNLLSVKVLNFINEKIISKGATYVQVDIFETIVEFIFNSSMSYDIEDILKQYIFDNNIIKYKELNWEEITLEFYEDEIFEFLFIEYDYCEYIIKNLLNRLQKYNYTVYTENMIFNKEPIEKGMIIIEKIYPKKKLH